MKNSIIWVFLFLFIIICNSSLSQNLEKKGSLNEATILFKKQDGLHLKLSYSNKDVKKKTNNSTYVKTTISYKTKDSLWNDIGVEIRKRGNFRLKKCYFTPIKIKIIKPSSKGTLFEGNKKLKLVLPCLNNKSKNDYILKEYLAYKLFELISPYHFKTRFTDLIYTEIKGNRTKIHFLKGFIIEDDKKVTKRYGGKIIERFIHPLKQDPISSVRNAFFQFMIGCTDFSTAYQHNQKLLFVNNKIIPIPYDFDISGLVNPSYAVFSGEKTENLGLSSVKERLYRGFKRNPSIIQQVRNEFLANKSRLIEIVDSFKSDFDDPKEFFEARKYILDFFEILENDIQYNNEITSKLRIK